MLLLAVVLFLSAALIGIYLLTFILQNKNTPKGVVFTHGPIAAMALVLLIIYAVLYGNVPLGSIILFIIAAIGGFTLVAIDIVGKKIPKWLAIGHGLIALSAFTWLVYANFIVA